MALNRQKLFPCQREALKVIASYLEDDRTDRSALVQMPMGTGKTGLMAIAGTQFPKYRRILIVAPFEYLVNEQIREAVTEKFWRDATLTPPEGVRATAFTPATLDVDAVKQPGFFLCTIQALQKMYVEGSAKYAALRMHIDLVLFDEAHYEPARMWAKAIRELRKKTILFTATPYRNDARRFHIDTKNYAYRFNYDEAQTARIIRRVEVSEYDKNESRTAFVRRILHLLDSEQRRFAYCRVLVKCKSAADITAIVNALNAERAGVAMGFHTAIAETAWLKRSVPRATTQIPQTVRCFVHEKLLVQGFDDSRFTALAIFGALDNARELIQQVGRVIRNRSKKRPETATVLLPAPSPYSAWWTNYLQAEKNPEAWVYKRREFRQTFAPANANFRNDLQFLLSARVFEVPQKLALPQVLRDILDELEEFELLVHTIDEEQEDTIGVLYTIDEQVPFIKEKVYFQSTLGYMVLHLAGTLLFFLDSHGLSPETLTAKYRTVDSRSLQKLFAGRQVRLTEVDLANCDISQHAVRSRLVRAFSIERSLNALSDHAYYCRSARGVPGSADGFARRYVGFVQGRVSDGQMADWDQFRSWAKSVAARVDSSSRPAGVFQRYAQVAPRPSKAFATSLLLDLDDVRDRIVATASGKPVANFSETCVDVAYDNNATQGNFTLGIDGRAVPVRIKYGKTRRFELISPSLHSEYQVQAEMNSGARPKSLLSYLNQEQAFRLTLLDRDLMYASGTFFHPHLQLANLTSETQIPMRQSYFPIAVLDGMLSEKGTRSIRGNSGWENNCLFGLIDSATRDGTYDIERLPWLVCDDQNNESADFIGMSPRGHRLVFIHAKSCDGEVSGTFFHDICGQVKKNLDYAHRYSDRRPPNFHLWDGPWNPAVRGRRGFQAGDYVARRLRRPDGVTAEQFWENARKIIANPAATIEVWMVIGGGFRFSRYYAELRKPEPSPQVVQIAYQLQSTLDAVSQIGARLRIFCRP